jgi:hypothetical protein
VSSAEEAAVVVGRSLQVQLSVGGEEFQDDDSFWSFVSFLQGWPCLQQAHHTKKVM